MTATCHIRLGVDDIRRPFWEDQFFFFYLEREDEILLQEG